MGHGTNGSIEKSKFAQRNAPKPQGNVDFSVNYMDVSDDQPKVEGKSGRKPIKSMTNPSMSFTGINGTENFAKFTGGSQSQSFIKN